MEMEMGRETGRERALVLRCPAALHPANAMPGCRACRPRRLLAFCWHKYNEALLSACRSPRSPFFLCLPAHCAPSTEHRAPSPPPPPSMPVYPSFDPPPDPPRPPPRPTTTRTRAPSASRMPPSGGGGRDRGAAQLHGPVRRAKSSQTLRRVPSAAASVASAYVFVPFVPQMGAGGAMVPGWDAAYAQWPYGYGYGYGYGYPYVGMGMGMGMGVRAHPVSGRDSDVSTDSHVSLRASSRPTRAPHLTFL